MGELGDSDDEVVLLTAEESKARMSLTEAQPDWSATMARQTCIACAGPIRWIDPAQLAVLDRDFYLQAKHAYGANHLLFHTVAWICTRCDELGIDVGDIDSFVVEDD